MKIFLIGLPGSGKTTVARLLAEKLNYTYLDLDKILERKNNQLIEEIWAKQGEKYFRALEIDILKHDIPQDEGNYVIACGGGVVFAKENKQYLDGLKIFLDTSVTVLEERLKTETKVRPLMKDVSIRLLYDQRYLSYRDFADITVTNNFDVNITIKVILNYLKAIE
jgi:shikimate kinase